MATPVQKAERWLAAVGGSAARSSERGSPSFLSGADENDAPGGGAASGMSGLSHASRGAGGSSEDFMRRPPTARAMNRPAQSGVATPPHAAHGAAPAPMAGGGGGGMLSPERYHRTTAESERLYEAYNDLHGLAQEFRKPFDSPAVVLVGHQTDGKSALVEALMGFQFNHVGGGTKTRRPITLHMKYNPTCVEPACYLLSEQDQGYSVQVGAGGQEVTLEELQVIIEQENRRLARDNAFSDQEIVVRIEYKFCPNLTIIDTPGLIHAAPGRKNAGQQAAQRRVERLVKAKMMQPEFIILCLEDNADWDNATTRSFVMQVDPLLERTVVVSTKFDTRLPQFGSAMDVESFLEPGGLLEETILGRRPFFTSVPSGRVGAGPGATYRSNDDFREAVKRQEEGDLYELQARLGRELSAPEQERVGVFQLRLFLEQLLQRKYLEHVPIIVPNLEREDRLVRQKLMDTKAELENLRSDKLREMGRRVLESFISKFVELLKGSIVPPAQRFGESLKDEHITGGAFVAPDGRTIPSYKHVENSDRRLYGIAQFNRLMAELRHVMSLNRCSDITREEILNACGIDDTHDGVNYTRVACVVATAKARDAVEPYVHQLGFRASHIAKRMLEIVYFMMKRDGISLSGHGRFLQRLEKVFLNFVEKTERKCRERCMEDLRSVTRYVTWSLHARNRGSLRSMLSNVATSHELQPEHSGRAAGGGGKVFRGGSGSSSPAAQEGGADQLLRLLEATVFTRELTPITEDMVSSLVACVFGGIREHLTQTIELKFNCFFLMPFVDEFPAQLRMDIESAYDDHLEEVFDVASVKKQLLAQEARLESEVESVKNLRTKFEFIYSTLQAKYRPRSVDRTPAAHGSLEKRFQKVGIEQQPARMPLARAVNRPLR